MAYMACGSGDWWQTRPATHTLCMQADSKLCMHGVLFVVWVVGTALKSKQPDRLPHQPPVGNGSVNEIES